MEIQQELRIVLDAEPFEFRPSRQLVPVEEEAVEYDLARLGASALSRVRLALDDQTGFAWPEPNSPRARRREVIPTWRQSSRPVDEPFRCKATHERIDLRDELRSGNVVLVEELLFDLGSASPGRQQLPKPGPRLAQSEDPVRSEMNEHGFVVQKLEHDIGVRLERRFLRHRRDCKSAA